MTPSEYYRALAQRGLTNQPPIILAAMLLNLGHDVLGDVTGMLDGAHHPAQSERAQAALHRDLANVLRVVTVFALAHGWSLDDLMAHTVTQLQRERDAHHG